jgi:hypothetical protein
MGESRLGAGASVSLSLGNTVRLELSDNASFESHQGTR